MTHNPVVVKELESFLQTTEKTAIGILDKAVAGGETTPTDEASWFSERLRPNVVLINQDGYTKMCIDALRIVSSVAGTDYGSTRQRDLAQLWADTTRGYLGELGFQLFLRQNYGVESELGHEQGELADYLPLDIHRVKKSGEDWRIPKMKLGIKATKWNGIWFDIPGDQFKHSHIHVLVKVGAGRNHLLAWLKSLGVFQDKILPEGRRIGHLSNDDVEKIYTALPNFEPIPAYVCGFVKTTNSYDELSYNGRLKRFSAMTKKQSYVIQSWNGPIHEGDLQTIRQRESATGSLTFEGIGSFAHNEGYLFNAGNLHWQKKEWAEVIESL